jgi:GTP-sensing pleiotropic transcriptional regulator CodY
LTPEIRTEDRLVGVLSRWLARDIPNDQLRRQIVEIGTAGLSQTEAEAVAEVLSELDTTSGTGRAHMERTVRETIEALALGI